MPKKIRMSRNISLLLGSLLVAGIAACVPFLFGPFFIFILRGCTGWGTCSLLLIGLAMYMGFAKEKLIYRAITIGSFTILFVGYLLYTIFNLEAIKFASSALIFDAGTALVAINVIVRLWSRLLIWLPKIVKSLMKTS